MRPTVLHTLLPRGRAEILRLLFTNPRAELFVRELARLNFLSLHTVRQELDILTRAGLLVNRTNGYQKFYRANPAHPLYTTLRRLVVKAARLRER